MPFPFLANIALGLVLFLAAAAIMPRPKQQKPPSVDELKEPTASVNRPRAVVFGSIRVRSPNVLMTADKSIKKRSITAGGK